MSDDYQREADVLRRLLSPGQPGTGMICGWDQPSDDNEKIYLGEGDVRFYSQRYVWEVTKDPDWQEHLVHATMLAGQLNHYTFVKKDITTWDWFDSFTVYWRFRVCAYIPLSSLHPFDQVLYRLRSLLVNNYEYGHGEGHEWALDVGSRLFEAYWDHQDSSRSSWEDAEWQDDEDMGPLARLVLAIVGDLEPWCSSYDDDQGREVPDTPALEWVQNQQLAGQLFPKITGSGYIKDINTVLSFILHSLRELQPPQWDTLLYLNDVFCTCKDAAKTLLVERLTAVPQLAAYTEQIRATDDFTVINTLLKEVYDTAPSHGVWVVS